MEENLLVSDLNSLKQLLNDPLYLIKEEFTDVKEILEQKPAIADSDTTPVETKIFNYIGSNNKQIAFIVFSVGEEIPAIDKILYAKTLSALKLTDDDVAFSIAELALMHSYQQIADEFPSQKIICFAESANYGSKLLTIVTVGKSTLFLCPSLSELQLDQALKIKWWNELKSFLN